MQRADLEAVAPEVSPGEALPEGREVLLVSASEQHVPQPLSADASP